MELLKKIVRELANTKAPVTEEAIVNIAREYLQVVILRLIYDSKYGRHLSFMGGTCLRICYNLKRYSEDLDFCLDHQSKTYSFAAMVEHVAKELSLRGYEVATNCHEDKIVQKAFLKFSGLQQQLGLKSYKKDQKLHIKVEVDIHPPRLKKTEKESFFVTRFDEVFPILKHNLPTLFAGKIFALLNRPYTRGRDYYDLIWYLGQKTTLNLDYLNRGLKTKKFDSTGAVMKIIGDKVAGLKSDLILKDIESFLEDPQDKTWLKRYNEVFKQLLQSYVS